MTKEQEALRLAIAWADFHGQVVFASGGMNAVNSMNEWRAALAEALAQPVQEPVAWVDSGIGQARVFASAWSVVDGRFDSGNGLEDAEQAKAELRAMLTTPPAAQPAQRPWVGLTFEERNGIWRKEIGWGDPSHNDEDLMKAIEAKLKEKNT